MPEVASPLCKGSLSLRWSSGLDEYPTDVLWAGNRICAATAAGTVFCFDSASGGEPLWSLGSASAGMTVLAADPKGDKLAFAGQSQEIKIVSLTTGNVLASMPSPFPWVNCLRWSPCGEMLASAAGKALSVWRDGVEEVRFDDHASTVADLAWVDREELVSTCYGQVTFWSRVNPESAARYLWKGSLLNLALSGDSEIIACGSQDKTVHFWRRSTGKDSAMSGFESKPTALAFSASNRFLATNGAPEICIWDFSGSGPEGTTPRQLTLHPSSATTLRFGHTADVLASGCRDGLLAHWIVPPETGEAIIGWAKLPGQIEKVAWNEDDSLLACIDSVLGLTLWQAAARSSSARPTKSSACSS